MEYRDGQFKPGVSGNPGGRPKVKDELKTALEKAGPEVLNKVIDLAKGGNIRAAEIVLNRIYPLSAYDKVFQEAIDTPIAAAIRALRKD